MLCAFRVRGLRFVKEFVKGQSYFAAVLGLGFAVGVAGGQTSVAPPPVVPEAQQPAASDDQPGLPKGEVIVQTPADAVSPEPMPLVEQTPVAAEAKKPSGPELTDAERTAVYFAAYDLDARLNPALGKLLMRARVTLRNDGTTPLTRVALQVSSTLQWESANELTAAGSKPLELSQHLLDTDTDHTGKANEAVIVLTEALAPGKTVVLDTFYSGVIAASAGRLERLGATHGQAMGTDWDAITEQATALRGFGDVLWYPVASRQLFLGDGAQLFDAIGAMKLREEAATIRLRLSVEYKGDPPTAAYFCGRRQAFAAHSDDDAAPIAEGTGIAAAEFAAEPLGFRVPSLFVVAQPERMTAPLPAFDGKAAEGAAKPAAPANPAPGDAGVSASNADAGAPGVPMLAVETDDDGALSALAASAKDAAPLLQDWLGPQPLSALTIVDHAGQPFEDGPLLVGPAAVLGTASASQALVHSLTHAWVQTGQPWMDEGLAQFFALLWTEREKGREAATAQLSEMIQPLSIAEPAIENWGAKEASAPGGELVGQVVGQPLIAATSELYYRRKAAAVWWMLRGIVGDDALEAALQAWRVQPVSKASAEDQARAFEVLLEKSGKKNAANPIDLRWFFNDWVLRDRGLPDLSITDVTPRVLPAGQGHSVGYLVAVTVKNDGAAAVEVPVTIRSATFSTTSRLRVAGFASATARVIVESPPGEVLVNDGEAPEVRTSFHKVTVEAAKAPL